MNQIAVYGCGRLGHAIAEYFPHVAKINSKTENKKKLLLDSNDIVVTCKGPGQFEIASDAFTTRLNEFEINKHSIDDFINNMQNIDTRIIVVTNPVDLFARYIKDNLPLAEVKAFGLPLDKYRYTNYCGKTVEVIGLHGKAIPLLGLDDKCEYIRIMDEVSNISLQDFKKNGINYELCSRLFFDYFKTIDEEIILNPNIIEHNILEQTMVEFEGLY